MKKLITVLLVIAVIAALALAALLVGTGADDANSKPVSIELDDTFER